MKNFISIMMMALIISTTLFTTAFAAQLTDVLDAADGEGDPIDFSISVDFIQEHEWATIARERNASNELIKQMLSQNEFDVKSIKSFLNINGKIGMYKDLEFHFTLPISIQEKSYGKQAPHFRNSFWAGNFDPSTTVSDSARPSLLKDSVFGFAAWESTHRGFGDMTLGITYSPVSESRQPEYPSWIITFDVQVPTGAEQKPSMLPAATNLQKGLGNNISVGKKLVSLIFKTAISKRMGAAEPYFMVQYKLPFSAGGMIKDPRHEGGFILGTEAIAYELKEEGTSEPLYKVAFDFRLSATLIGRGQDFNAITDPLSWRKDNDGKKYWPDDPRQNYDNPHIFYNYPNYQAPEYELPIEDRYAYVQGLFGIYAIIYHYVTLKTEFTFGHRTEHFLSLPEDLNFTTLRPADIGEYNTQINEIGARVKLVNSFVFSYMFSLSFNY